jgi:hypothetical protein
MNIKNLLFATVILVGLGAGIANANQQPEKPNFHPVQAYKKIDTSKEGLLNYKKESEEKLKKLENELSSE